MKKENEFILPEKWSVSVNEENKNILNDWRDSELFSSYGFINQDGLWMPELMYFNDDAVEITFDQFKEHVLKEISKPEYDPKDVAFKDVYSKSEFNSETFETKCGHVYTEENKIIGYKLIKPEYKEAVKDIVCIHEDGERWFNDRFEINVSEFGYNFESKRGVCDLIKKAGVMHWFEPVYKKESITLKSGVKLSEDDIAEVKEILNNK